MLLEKFEEQEALATAPNADKDFDQIVPFSLNKPIQEKIAGNDHKRNSDFNFVALLRKLETAIVYHIFMQGHGRDLNFCASAQKCAKGWFGIAVYNVEEPRVPLKLAEKPNFFKLFMNDVGLLSALYIGSRGRRALCADLHDDVPGAAATAREDDL